MNKQYIRVVRELRNEQRRIFGFIPVMGNGYGLHLTRPFPLRPRFYQFFSKYSRFDCAASWPSVSNYRARTHVWMCIFSIRSVRLSFIFRVFITIPATARRRNQNKTLLIATRSVKHRKTSSAPPPYRPVTINGHVRLHVTTATRSNYELHV